MKNFSNKRAFTLIEVLAATGIMTVVILVVLTMTTNVVSVWNKSAGKLSSNFEGRVALKSMEADLQSLVLRSRPAVNWLQIQWERPNTGSGPTVPYSFPTIYMVTRAMDRPQYRSTGETITGRTNTVVYKLAYQNPITGSTNNTAFPAPMFALYRFVIDAENTFRFVTNSVSNGDFQAAVAGTHLSTTVGGSRFVNEDGVEIDIGNLDESVLTRENFLSANVVDFEVTIFFRDNAGNLQEINPAKTSPNGTTNFLIGSTSTGDFALVNNGRPEPNARVEFIDVTLSVLSEEGVGVVTNDPSVDWDDLLAQYSTTFTRRINVMANMPQ
ncbi:MAG: prepilin-type N-terminal cleavage/methylation domain-containing protein [Verrucomicrobiota bacterium]